MMFEMRMPRNADRAPPGELGAIVSPTSFESEYDDSGRGSMRLVDRREGRRDIERQTEDRLARRPHDTPDPVGDRRGEDVVGGQGVDPERLAVGPEPGAGIAAKWTTASAPASASSV